MGDFEQGKRLKFIIEGCYKLTPVEFAKAYNDPKAVKTYHILSGRNGISNKMLELILKAYPDINQGWLLTGEGEPIKKGPTAPSFVIPEKEKSDYDKYCEDSGKSCLIAIAIIAIVVIYTLLFK